MAIKAVKRIAPQDGQIERIGERQYREMYIVESDVTDEVPIDVFFAAGLPRWGDTCPWDGDCEVTGILPVQSTNRKYTWHVQVLYGVKRDFTWRASVSTAIYRLALPVDLDNRPFTNSAGDPYDKRNERESTITVIEFRREQETFDSTQPFRLNNTLNQQPLYGAPADSILLSGIVAQERKWGDGSTWTQRVVLHYHPLIPVRVPIGQNSTDVVDVSPWHNIQLDAGLYQWIETPWIIPEFDQQGTPIGERTETRYVRLPILDGARQPVRKPVPLDGYGKALFPNGIDEGLSPVDLFNKCVFNVFRKHASTSWGELNLPD